MGCAQSDASVTPVKAKRVLPPPLDRVRHVSISGSKLNYPNNTTSSPSAAARGSLYGSSSTAGAARNADSCSSEDGSRLRDEEVSASTLLGSSANSYLTDEDHQQVQRIRSRRRKQFTLSRNQSSLDHYRNATFQIDDPGHSEMVLVVGRSGQPVSVSEAATRDCDHSDVESLVSSCGGRNSRSALKKSPSADHSAGGIALSAQNLALLNTKFSDDDVTDSEVASVNAPLCGAMGDAIHPHTRSERATVVTIIGDGDLGVASQSDNLSLNSGRRRSVRFAGESNSGSPTLVISPTSQQQQQQGSTQNSFSRTTTEDADVLDDLILGPSPMTSETPFTP